ncbi:hypothetical protein R3P38DRAFT_3516096 [Favolaschia claudopus]|uniref:Uncharacterized protein n=1 Tax=Favolaschia claudopus TaxID=2862362 RepID=A0AAW0BQP9_9AGAR
MYETGYTQSRSLSPPATAQRRIEILRSPATVTTEEKFWDQKSQHQQRSKRAHGAINSTNLDEHGSLGEDEDKESTQYNETAEMSYVAQGGKWTWKQKFDMKSIHTSHKVDEPRRHAEWAWRKARVGMEFGVSDLKADTFSTSSADHQLTTLSPALNVHLDASPHESYLNPPRFLIEYLGSEFARRRRRWKKSVVGGCDVDDTLAFSNAAQRECHGVSRVETGGQREVYGQKTAKEGVGARTNAEREKPPSTAIDYRMNSKRSRRKIRKVERKATGDRKDARMDEARLRRRRAARRRIVSASSSDNNPFRNHPFLSVRRRSRRSPMSRQFRRNASQSLHLQPPNVNTLCDRRRTIWRTEEMLRGRDMRLIFRSSEDCVRGTRENASKVRVRLSVAIVFTPHDHE